MFKFYVQYYQNLDTNLHTLKKNAKVKHCVLDAARIFFVTKLFISDYSRSNENEQQPQVVQKIQTALSRQQSTLRLVLTFILAPI